MFASGAVGFDMIGLRPRLKAWQKNILATGLGPKSTAPDFEKAFSAFYLSGETYLGRGCKDLCGADAAEQTCKAGSCC